MRHPCIVSSTRTSLQIRLLSISKIMSGERKGETMKESKKGEVRWLPGNDYNESTRMSL